MNATDFLKLKGLTSNDLAKQLGCSNQNVSMWISGKSSPNVSTIEKLTAALNALGAKTDYAEVFTVLRQSRQERKERA
jgi:transcriptional regulator with XRE-family HTH domain